MPDTTPERRRPADGARYVTVGWLDAVKATLKARNMSQRDLARQIGVSQPSIQEMLAGQRRTSRHVQAISELLSIGLPDEMKGEAERLYKWARKLVDLGAGKMVQRQADRFEAAAEAIEEYKIGR